MQFCLLWQAMGAFVPDAEASNPRSCGPHYRWDLNTAKTFLSVDEPNKSAIHTAQIHPDGLLLGTGSADSMVYIWDIKEAKSVAEFAGHTVCYLVAGLDAGSFWRPYL